MPTPDDDDDEQVLGTPHPDHIWGEGLSAAAVGVSILTFKRMKVLGCPFNFFMLLTMMRSAVDGCLASDGLILLELFCGVAAITRAFNAAGLPATGYDYLKDPYMNDINSPAGFICALTMLLTLHPTDGLLWLATVCSTWVWMSRGSTMRSLEFPLGMPCHSTAGANQMVARCGLLIMLCMAFGCAWILEQPATSLMVMHPVMVWLASHNGRMLNCDWFEASTSMAAFNAETVKQTKLYGNRRSVFALARKKPTDMRSESRDVVRITELSDGRPSVTGGSGLKATQAYTDDFGEAVLEAYIACGGGPEIADGLLEDVAVPSGVWDLADLSTVLEFACQRDATAG